MCGIVGRLSDRPVTEAEIGRMCDAIAHRGPDDWGSFVEGDVGLGMRLIATHTDRTTTSGNISLGYADVNAGVAALENSGPISNTDGNRAGSC